jgi:putative nucleotidyltransferase with HDIG domain
VSAPPDKLASEIERIVLGRIASSRLVLPAMPVTAANCLALLRDPAKFDSMKLAAEIESDPLLAAMVIHAANTAVMNQGEPAKVLHQAMARLGAQRLKVLIVERAATEVFRSSNAKIAEADRRVWEHSLVVAIIARDIAALVGNTDPDMCYLAGLLHDVGKPILASMLLEVERKMPRTPGSSFIDASQWTGTIERVHRKIGIALAVEWKLPEEIASAIRDCSDYDPGERNSPPNIVRLANALAKREGFTTGPIDASDVEAMVMVGQSMLGTDPSVVNRLLTGIRPRLPKVM